MADTLDPALEAALDPKALEAARKAAAEVNYMTRADVDDHVLAVAIRAYLSVAAPQAELDRLRLMLETLVASVRSVLVELKLGESLRPAGAGKTNILVSDVNAAERILRSLHPETPNGGQNA